MARVYSTWSTFDDKCVVFDGHREIARFDKESDAVRLKNYLRHRSSLGPGLSRQSDEYRDYKDYQDEFFSVGEGL